MKKKIKENNYKNQLSFGGHVFGQGYFNIDEDGNEIFYFDNPDEFYRIGKTVKLIEIVNKAFKNNYFLLGIGPNNSVLINDVDIVPNCYWDIPEKDELFMDSKDKIVRKVKDFLAQKEDNTIIDINKLEQCIIKSICNLDVSYLSELEEGIMYSFRFKDEVIIDFSTFFKKLLLKGITSLTMKTSKCLYCYPKASAFSFYHPETDEFVVRYVVGNSQNEMTEYILEQCRNRPLSKDVLGQE